MSIINWLIYAVKPSVGGASRRTGAQWLVNCAASLPAGVAVVIILNWSLFTEVCVTCHSPPKHCGKGSGAVGR